MRRRSPSKLRRTGTRRLELGEVNFLQVLVAQQFYLQALLARVQAQANRFSDTVALQSWLQAA